MREVIIIGNSGAARECYWLLHDMLQADPALRSVYAFKGFLGWQGYAQQLKSLADLNLGDAAAYPFQERLAETLLVIGIGSPALRKVVFEHYAAMGANFLTLIHPWTDINPTAQIGEANIFQRGSTVFCDAVVGNANYLNGAVNLSHDARLENYNFVGPASLLLGECSVGSGNMFGAHTTVLPKAVIGDNNMFAPGSIVYKGCRSNQRMAGNPALTIGETSATEVL